MSTDLQKQFVLNYPDSGVLPLGDEINHLVGTTATLLEAPAGARYFFYKVENKNFRAMLGDQTGSISASAPGASVTNGTGSWKLTEGSSGVLPAATELTVKGDDAAAILTYYWV